MRPQRHEGTKKCGVIVVYWGHNGTKIPEKKLGFFVTLWQIKDAYKKTIGVKIVVAILTLNLCSNLSSGLKVEETMIEAFFRPESSDRRRQWAVSR